MCSITMRPSVVPSSGGSDTSPPGKAETSLGQLAQLEEIGGHGAVDPTILLEGRIEDAARPGLLRLILRFDVIHRAAGRCDHYIRLHHRRRDRFGRLHAALGPRRHHDDDRIGADTMGRARQALGNRGAGSRIGHDDHLLAGLGAHVVGDDAMRRARDFDRLRQGMSSMARREGR